MHQYLNCLSKHYAFHTNPRAVMSLNIINDQTRTLLDNVCITNIVQNEISFSHALRVAESKIVHFNLSVWNCLNSHNAIKAFTSLTLAIACVWSLQDPYVCPHGPTDQTNKQTDNHLIKTFNEYAILFAKIILQYTSESDVW